MCEFLIDSDVDPDGGKCLGRVNSLGGSAQFSRSYSHADVSIKVQLFKIQFITHTVFISITKYICVVWWVPY